MKYEVLTKQIIVICIKVHQKIGLGLLDDEWQQANRKDTVLKR
jgi:hypothetical protein